jgi:predicted RNase H-like HicB family nuclease
MRVYTAIIEKCKKTGLYIGSVPGIPGAHSQGETLDELNTNLKEVIEMLLEDGEPDIEGNIGSDPHFPLDNPDKPKYIRSFDEHHRLVTRNPHVTDRAELCPDPQKTAPKNQRPKPGTQHPIPSTNSISSSSFYSFWRKTLTCPSGT